MRVTSAAIPYDFSTLAATAGATALRLYIERAVARGERVPATGVSASHGWRTAHASRREPAERGVETMDAQDIPILVTERLRLRSFRGSDFEDYAALNSDSEVLRHLGCGMEPWDR